MKPLGSLSEVAAGDLASSAASSQCNTTTAVHDQLTSLEKALYLTEELGTMKKTKRCTMYDIAREAGVSRTAVSFVLSNSPHISMISLETRDKIRAVASAMGYSRNPAATALRRGYSDGITLLVVTWDLATAYSGAAMTMSRAARRHDLTLTVDVVADDEDALRMIDGVSVARPYGLVVLWDSQAECVERVLEQKLEGVPIVDLLPTAATGRNVSCVTADREQGFYDLVRYLTGLGHKRIALVLDRVKRNRTASRKLAGYIRGLEEAHIGFDPELLQDTADASFEAGHETLPRILDRCPDTTAVICTDDRWAIGIAVAAQEMGLSVPGDLSVAGCDDQPEARIFRPKLTSIAYPMERVAEHAVQSLVRMRQDAHFQPEPVFEPVELMIRDSTGPVSKSVARGAKSFHIGR